MSIPTKPICNDPTCGREILDDMIIVAKLKKSLPHEHWWEIEEDKFFEYHTDCFRRLASESKLLENIVAKYYIHDTNTCSQIERL